MKQHAPLLLVMVLATIVITLFVDQGRSKAVSTRSNDSPEKALSKRDSAAAPSIGDQPARYWTRTRKPFKAAVEKTGFSWTNEDGTRPEVMRTLANNEVMLRSLEVENTSIIRRQLIYAPEDFGELAREIYLDREDRLSLPGFDGELFPVVVRKVVPHDTPEVSGGFIGQIDGIEDSSVVAASERDHWSIGITLPDRHLQITTREQGEWILVEHNPNAPPLVADCSCCPGGVHQKESPPLGPFAAPPTGSSIDAVGTPISSPVTEDS